MIIAAAVAVTTSYRDFVSPESTPVLKNLSTPFFKPGVPPALQPLEASDWNLVFAEEFDDASCPGGRPNASRWAYEHGFVRNHEQQWYQSDNAVCRDGLLTITAERVTPDPSKGNANYTSASMTSRGLAEFQYGRFEMRGKIDIRSGSWPAWWWLGSDTTQYGWPKCGEIDMMEYYRGLIRGNIMYANRDASTHWIAGTTHVDDAWAQSFHNWTMLWDADHVHLYLDGRPVSSVAVSAGSTGGDWPNPFRQKAFMIVNQAIGGDNGGDPAHTTFPIIYQVDYIRVYQGGAPSPPVPPSSKGACAAHCASLKQDGCCDFGLSTGVCAFRDGKYVDGGSSAPSESAANCYAAGRCDGWNDGQRCQK